MTLALAGSFLPSAPVYATSRYLSSQEASDPAAVTLEGEDALPGAKQENEAIEAYGAETGGICGNDLTWTLDDLGTVTITGIGRMYDYKDKNSAGIGMLSPFNSNENIKKIVIAPGVTSIGDYAFQWCRALTSVEMGTVASIGKGAFANDMLLKEVNFGEGLNEIGQDAFKWCAISELRLPDSLKSIEAGAFYGCSNLTELSVPDETELHHSGSSSGIFGYCDSLKKVYIGRNGVDLSGKDFTHCTSLREVNVSAQNPALISEDGIVYSYNKATLIYYPAGRGEEACTVADGVTTIGSNAFNFCTELVSLKLSDSVRRIESDGISGCNALTDVDLNQVRSLNGAFFSCTALSKIVFPDTLRSLEGCVFYGCTGLCEIYFRGERPSISQNAFYDKITADVYYPKSDKENWTEDKMPAGYPNYGGILTWKTYSDGGITDIDISPAVVLLSQTEFTYDGEEKQPEVSVSYYGRRLTEGTDYYAFFLNNREIGEAVVVISGIGNYSGEIRKTFRILDGSQKTETDKLSEEALSYSFDNTLASFGYERGYKIPEERYIYIFGDNTKARSYFKTQNPWGGNCFGFSATSSLLFDTENQINVPSFSEQAAGIGELKTGDISSSYGFSVTEFIEALQISQKSRLVKEEIKKNRVYTVNLTSGNADLNSLGQTVREEAEKNRPVILAVYQMGGHAILAYGLEAVNAAEDRILIYDSNHPKEGCYLSLTKDGNGNYTGWSYDMGGVYGVWGDGDPESSISFIPYGIIEEVWRDRGRLEENINIATFNSLSLTIYDGNDRPVASLENGKLAARDNNISIVEDDLILGTSLSSSEEGSSVTLSLPIDAYTVVNNDKRIRDFSVSVIDTNLGAEAVTSADRVIFAVDDSENLNMISIPASKGDTYSVTLLSSFAWDKDEVEISGRGLGETLEISQSMGEISLNNCQVLSMSVEGESILTRKITATAEAGGIITPPGENTVVVGSNQAFAIVPDEGYSIRDVYVDGESVGAVSSFLFRDIDEDHTIDAEFVLTGKQGIWLEGMKEGYTYTGAAIKPDPIVHFGEETLKKGRDYTISYTNNVKVGTAALLLKFKGNLSGTFPLTFKINKIALSDVEIKPVTVSYKSGRIQKPKPEIYLDGKKITCKANDLSFEYSDEKTDGNAYQDPGSYSISVAPGAAGTFTGSAQTTVTIENRRVMNDVQIRAKGTKLGYSGKEQVPEYSLSYEGETLKEGEDYFVFYEDPHTDIGDHRITFVGNGNSLIGERSVSFSITGKYDITGKAVVRIDESSINEKGEVAFSASGAAPGIIVEYNGRILESGSDYMVKYQNNKGPGQAFVTVTGKGAYKGVSNGSFRIGKRDISSLRLTVNDVKYSNRNGAFKKITPVFTDDDYKKWKLREGTDYEMVFSEPSDTAPGPGTEIFVTIKGMGDNYSGEIRTSYRVADPKKDIGKAKVIVNGGIPYSYTGKKIEPGKEKLSVSIGGAELNEEDYEIIGYYNNIKAGSKAYVQIRGAGGYTGVKLVTFKIRAVDAGH